MARPDEDVVAAVVGGDTPHFELLMRRYNQRLFRVARAITRSDDDAEDVVQETYVRAFTHLGEFEGRSSFATWLTRICVNEALQRGRRQRRRDARGRVIDAAEVDMSSFPSDGPSPEDRASDREMGGVIEHAIDALPDDFREVFVMRAVEQLSVAEVSACLDINEQTVKTRFFRARGLLKDDLVRRLEDGATRAFSFDGARCDRIVRTVMERIR